MTQNNLQKLQEEMKKCEQFDNFTVLDHGNAVHNVYIELLNHAQHNTAIPVDYRIPEWIFDKRIIDGQLDIIIMQNYQIMHDVGKNNCVSVDENGQRHFPNHAAISKQVWDEHSDGSENDNIVGELIGMDMLAHTVKGDDLQAFVKHSYAPSLLLTALAEVHANAKQLNRLQSDGFKIKCKQLDKVAKNLLKSMT